MTQTRTEVIERLLGSYERYYNLVRYDDPDSPVKARCEYFEHNERYVLMRRAQLWETSTEEFIYLIDLPHLTRELFDQWVDWTRQDGMQRLNIGPSHMASFITPIFVCDSCDDAAKKAVRRCRIQKSFHFSLHGWMDIRAVALEVPSNQVVSNASGRETAEILKKVLGLLPRTKKRRE